MTTISPVNMGSMIEKLQPILSQSPNSSQTSPQTSESSFTDILKNAMENVEQTEAIANHDIELVATGQVDDLHTVMLDAAKAELALTMFVQVRNKALEAYNEIMNINL